MTKNQFTVANRLWFREGRTARAVRAYEDALRDAPTDPVVAFQYGRVLWSLDRFAEARSMLERASSHREALSPTGREMLGEWLATARRDPPERTHPELPPALLDRDRLKPGAPGGNWRAVADAASDRGMYGVALYAVERWSGVPVDADDAREIGKIVTNRDYDEQALRWMRPAADPDRGRQPSGPVSAAAVLELVVAADPPDGPVGTPTTIAATVRNVGPSEQVVNRRMLLNDLGGAGEVWLDVRGPAGYRNAVQVLIRAGRAPDQFFVPLAPGGSVRQSWTLNDYASVDVPGDYVVTLTYHNESDAAPDGRPMAVGTVSGSTRFHRHRSH